MTPPAAADPVLRQTACDWCFGVGEGEAAATFYRGLFEIGFGGIEMPDEANWEAARAAGLEILDLVGPGMEWGLNRVEEHDAIIPLLVDAIDNAAANGVKNVVVFSGNRQGLSDATGIANCIAGLTVVAPHAERAGVGLLLEVLNSVEHLDYHADSASFVFDVVGAVDSPALSALYDVYHVQRMGGDPITDLESSSDLIGHIHIAGSPKRDFPGLDQEIDYAGVVAAALGAGYKGSWGHEFIAEGDPLDELRRSFELIEAAAVAVRTE
jgi:hydroxypyruvate isomerase